MSEFSSEWAAFRSQTDLDEYDTRWDRLEAEGHDVHGEADFVMSFGPKTVLDAGCGMGRVAIELDRRGVDVIGVDLDDDLLERARRRRPNLTWLRSNLSTIDLDQVFDVIVMAGNVLPFADENDRLPILIAGHRHLSHDGVLIMGMHLRPDWPTPEEYLAWAEAANLTLVDRFSGWRREPWPGDGTYLVAVFETNQSPSDRESP